MYSLLSVTGEAVTVNESVVEPPFAESVTVATPAGALDATLNVADAALPALLLLTLLNVRPDHPVESATAQRLLPLAVTSTPAPAAMLFGVSEVTTGAAGGSIITDAETVTHGVLSVFLTAVKT